MKAPKFRTFVVSVVIVKETQLLQLIDRFYDHLVCTGTVSGQSECNRSVTVVFKKLRLMIALLVIESFISLNGWVIYLDTYRFLSNCLCYPKI